jgi:hypothetical protein
MNMKCVCSEGNNVETSTALSRGPPASKDISGGDRLFEVCRSEVASSEFLAVAPQGQVKDRTEASARKRTHVRGSLAEACHVSKAVLLQAMSENLKSTSI